MRLQSLAFGSATTLVVAFAFFTGEARTVRAQTSGIVLGATVAQRQEAARALVPLLNDLKAHAQPGTTLKPGSAPNSPFTGRPSTLFAFTLSKRSVPVDPRVVEAMDRLLQWQTATADDATSGDTLTLFDRWLVELEARSSRTMRLAGDSGLCDVTCVVARLTTLNEAWGSSPKTRGDVRDEMMLDALRAVVLSP